MVFSCFLIGIGWLRLGFLSGKWGFGIYLFLGNYIYSGEYWVIRYRYCTGKWCNFSVCLGGLGFTCCIFRGFNFVCGVGIFGEKFGRDVCFKGFTWFFSFRSGFIFVFSYLFRVEKVEGFGDVWKVILEVIVWDFLK